LAIKLPEELDTLDEELEADDDAELTTSELLEVLVISELLDEELMDNDELLVDEEDVLGLSELELKLCAKGTQPVMSPTDNRTDAN
jgi:hypothetical protein